MQENPNSSERSRGNQPATPERQERERADRERDRLLLRLETALEPYMFFLGLAWLVLLIVELTRGLQPFLEYLSIAIWITFIIDFSVKLALAPRKLLFIRRNVLTMVALVIPALRIFRIFMTLRFLHAARAVRGVRLVRIITSLNRGMRALGLTMARRGFGYVVALTALVTFAGAAGMFAFERNPAGHGINDYGTALWWTAMIMTTMGSDFWPRTPEGRFLTLVLSFYAFAVWGYITATIAAFFIDRDAAHPKTELPNAASIKLLHKEIAALRAELHKLAPPGGR